jgi:hypothetical protein
MRKFIVISAAALLTMSSFASAATLTQGFEVVTPAGMPGWKFSNQSTSASANLWRQGSGTATGNGPAPDGAATAYAVANYTDTSSTAASGATISNWLVTPVLAFNGATHTLTFKTRTGTAASFADRLEVRLSSATNGTGTLPTDVGDFTTVLTTINPNQLAGIANYPDTWTTYSVSIPGASVPADGYVAFRYFVTNAGVNGANSNIIGLDTVSISAVPEPTSLALLAVSGTALLRRRRA